MAVPFLFDVEVQIRYLVALPLMISAELIVHRRMRSILEIFQERRLVPEPAVPRFDAAIATAMRWRNSVRARATQTGADALDDRRLGNRNDDVDPPRSCRPRATAVDLLC